MRPLLIYIHGFNSSSQSQKAQEVKHYLQHDSLSIDFLAPTFSNYPAQCYQQLLQIIDKEQQQHKQIALIGSSLGGFMATCASQHRHLRAVLVNPAVHPHKLVHHFLGEHTNTSTGETFTLREEHIDELRELEPEHLPAPHLLQVLLQTGDETLDYRDAGTYYKDCELIIEQGGDHRFQGFDQHLPAILQFLQLNV